MKYTLSLNLVIEKVMKMFLKKLHMRNCWNSLFHHRKLDFAEYLSRCDTYTNNFKKFKQIKNEIDLCMFILHKSKSNPNMVKIQIQIWYGSCGEEKLDKW